MATSLLPEIMSRLPFLLTVLLACSLQTTWGIVDLSPFEIIGERDSQSNSPLTGTITLGFELDEEYGSGDWFDAFPELTLSSSGAGQFGSIMTIRGSSNTPFFSESPLAIYIDDTPILSPFALPSWLAEVSAVTYQKGALPSYSSLNNTSGILTVHSFNDLFSNSADLTVRISEDNGWLASVKATTFTENLGVGIALYKRTQDGFTINTTTGNDLGYVDEWGGLFKLHYAIDETSSLKAQIIWNEANNGEQAFAPIFGNPYETEKPSEGITDFSDFSFTATYTKTFADLLFRSSFTQGDWEIGPYTTVLVFPPVLASDLTQEFQYTLWDASLGNATDNQSFTWETGFTLLEKDVKGVVSRSIGGWPFEASNIDRESNEWALRLNGSLELNESNTLGVGIRYEEHNDSYVRTETIPGSSVTQLKKSDDALSLSAFYQNQFSESGHIVARISESYRPGGFSAWTSNPVNMSFDEERVRSVEVSAVFADPEKLWSARIDAYQNKIDGLQIERSFTESDYMVLNTGTATVNGLEAALSMRSKDSVFFGGVSLAYTDAQFDKYIDPFSGMDFSGNTVPFVPELAATANLNARLADNWTLTGSATYTDSRYFEEANDPTFQTDSSFVVDLSIHYALEEWSIELGVNNAFDETSVGYINPGIYQQVYNTPRRAYLSFVYSFR